VLSLMLSEMVMQNTFEPQSQKGLQALLP